MIFENGMIFENVEFLRDQKSPPVFREMCRDRLVFIFTDRFDAFHVRSRVKMYLVFVFTKGQYGSEYGSEFKTSFNVPNTYLILLN